MKQFLDDDVLGTKNVRTKPEYTAYKSPRRVRNFWLTYFFPALIVIGVVVFFYLNQKLLYKIVDKFAITWSGIFASEEQEEKKEETAYAETVLEAYAASATHSNSNHGGAHGTDPFIVDENHKCICCGSYITPTDENPKDHKCDVCGFVIGECKDTNKDHKCDVCGAVLSECKDINKDHKCDVCGKKLSECIDANKDHKCDVCGKVVSQCVDVNKDHICDICGKGTACIDKTPKDHKCDICDKVLSQCIDANKDHKCDICGKVLSQCKDESPKDHKCDICEQFIGCKDDNRDHKCDMNDLGCTRKFCGDCAEDESACNGKCEGKHTFDPGEHTCNYCKKYKSPCKDKNWDMLCDICGKIYYPWYTALIIVASPFLLLWLLLILREWRKVRRVKKVRIEFYKDLVVYVDKKQKKDKEFQYRTFLGTFSATTKFANEKGKRAGKAKRNNYGTVTVFCPGGPAMSMTFHNIDNPGALAAYLNGKKPDESVSYNASNKDMLN